MKILVTAIFAATRLLSGATIYTVIDLGAVDPNAPPPMSYSNAAGQSVGGNGYAYVTNGTTTTNLGTLPGGQSSRIWDQCFG